jgi:hypothetical protein
LVWVRLFFTPLITCIASFNAQPLAQLCGVLFAGVDDGSGHQSLPNKLRETIRGFLSNPQVL